MVLAVDNDQGVKEFIDKMNQIVNADLIKADTPKGAKDWKDELKKNGKTIQSVASRLRNKQIIDKMDGRQFEFYLQALFQQLGYK
ncbi:hypothetical protein SAMN04487777_104164 [Priestia aryabhattai B8W22]|nr:hypothetical protein SAMN04487777_104164 [Priestia aryabhattai B8W22]